ncbi:P-loop NTPase fold protein [Streptomyces sp. NPDC021020]|uniref:P-loop NTPase fold protein n=1 Tax=Streptomyces sp. NPDC021020 TaxID=3365109 RepID=UPI0037A4DBFF
MTDTTPEPDRPTFRLVPYGEPAVSDDGWVRSLTWMDDGARPVLATGAFSGTLQLWEVAGTRLLPLGASVLAEQGGIRSMSRTDVDDRPLLATGGHDGSVRLWGIDGSRLSPVGEPTPRRGSLLRVAWTRVSRLSVLATGDNSGSVQLWRLSGTHLLPLGEPVRTGRSVQSLAWTHTGGRHLLAAGSHDGQLLLWELDASGLAPLPPVLASRGTGVTSVAWTYTGTDHFLATGHGDGLGRLWKTADSDFERLTPLGDVAAGSLLTAWVSVGGHHLMATGSEAGTVRLWQLAHDSLVGFDEPTAIRNRPIEAMAWTHSGDRLLLATGSSDGAVHLWEVVEDRPVPRLPAYRSDAPAAVDELARAEDARALADLVTARSARPPLAVGLFGDWGEGKSHFLGLLQQEVARVARTGDPLAHQAVRQIRFNAWHYAETGLWASLVAEMFAQLAAPAGEDDDAGQAQRSMSRLTAELVTQRRYRPRLDAARSRRDGLERALRRRGRFRELPQDQQDLLADNAEGYAEARRAYRRTTGRAGRLRFLAGVYVRGLPLRQSLWLAAGVAVVAGGTAALEAFGPLLLAGLAGLGGGAALLAWAATLYAAIPGLRTRVRRARELLAEARGFAEAQRARLENAVEVARAEVGALERELQNLTAAGQLAGLIGDRAAAGDYRGQLGVMTQIREDFERMAALLARAAAEPPLAGPGGADADRDEAADALPRIDRIVLYIDDLDRCPPVRVIEMLEAVHLLLAVELFVVVVAIDPRWLLRAVAAHYRDVLDVAAAPGASDAGDGALWAATPAQYLEKIFQVVLTLPSLDTSGYRSMLRTLVGVRADRPDEAPDPAEEHDGTAAGQGGAVGGGRAPAAGAGSADGEVGGGTGSGPATGPGAGPAGLAAGQGAAAGVPGTATASTGGGEWSAGAGPTDIRHGIADAPATGGRHGVRVVERTDPLTLDPDELALLDLLGPPGFVSTPRAVKRLANSYGLLTALRRAHREADLAEVGGGAGEATHRPYRAGMVLLAALVAYPALGPALCLHLHRRAADEPGRTWDDFRAGLVPRPDPAGGHARNDAVAGMPPAQAAQWGALCEALDSVTADAAAQGRHLPARLGVWGPWVLPVARLSFPAGRILPALRARRAPVDGP